MLISDDALRAMYREGRGNPTARRYARFWARVFDLGLAPKRWVTMEVKGRSSGRIARYPLGMADHDGCWYLVPMLGAKCGWVKNVRAANGEVTLRHWRGKPYRLTELPETERPEILQRYLEKVPGARPHFPVGRGASLDSFAAIAADYPVFRVDPLQRGRKGLGVG